MVIHQGHQRGHCSRDALAVSGSLVMNDFIGHGQVELLPPTPHAGDLGSKQRFGNSFKRRISRRLNESSCATNRHGAACRKKKRGDDASEDDDDAYKCKSKAAEASQIPRIHGPALDQLVVLVQHACSVYTELPLGTPVWAKLGGFCAWPGIIWSLDHCRKMEAPDVIMSFLPGCCLVHFFGEHSNAWLNAADISPMQLGTAAHKARLTGMITWGRKANRSDLVAATLAELEGACSLPDSEVDRVKRMTEVIFGMKFASSRLCSLCRQEGAQLHCCHCQRSFHPLCLKPPVLSMQHMAKPAPWACPCCQEDNYLKTRHRGDGVQESDEAIEQSRMGLTPDWIIHEAAFRVFGLPQPTPEQPFIKGLLDPCTNSKVAPNIPAELLYDRRDDGLRLENSWAGNYIILNPPYKSQIQWRFVNRAIDGVENRTVPAVVLVTRNSTDTAYYQRLRPYPRVLLRRGVVIFKDYERTPIGFGVAVFLIARADCTEMYARFYEAFSDWPPLLASSWSPEVFRGEASIPIDKSFMQSREFPLLLERLRLYAAEHHRDHWVQCSKCRKWRMISYDAISHVKDLEWSCDLLKPPHSNCDTALTKYEACGIRYATSGKGDIWWELHGRRRLLQQAARGLPAMLPLDTNTSSCLFPGAAPAASAALCLAALPAGGGGPDPIPAHATALGMAAPPDKAETAAYGTATPCADERAAAAAAAPGSWIPNLPCTRSGSCPDDPVHCRSSSFFLEPYPLSERQLAEGGDGARRATSDLAALLHPDDVIDPLMDYFDGRSCSSGGLEASIWQPGESDEEMEERSEQGMLDLGDVWRDGHEQVQLPRQDDGGMQVYRVASVMSQPEQVVAPEQETAQQVVSLQMMPAEQVPAGQMMPEQMPAGQMLSGQTPTEQVLSEQIAAQQASAEQLLSGPMPAEQLLSGQMPAEQLLSGQMPAKQTQTEQLLSGQALSEQVPAEMPLTATAVRMPQEHTPPDQMPAECQSQVGSKQAEPGQPQQALWQQEPLCGPQAGPLCGPQASPLCGPQAGPLCGPQAGLQHCPASQYKLEAASLDLARQARMLATRACIADSHMGASQGHQGQHGCSRSGLGCETQGSTSQAVHSYLVQAGCLVAGHAEADRARCKIMAIQQRMHQEMLEHAARLRLLQLEEEESKQQLDVALSRLEKMQPTPPPSEQCTAALMSGPSADCATGYWQSTREGDEASALQELQGSAEDDGMFACAAAAAVEHLGGQPAGMEAGAGPGVGALGQADIVAGAGPRMGAGIEDQAGQLASDQEGTPELQPGIEDVEPQGMLELGQAAVPPETAGDGPCELLGPADGVQPMDAGEVSEAWPLRLRHGRAARAKLTPKGLADRIAFVWDALDASDEEEDEDASTSLPAAPEVDRDVEQLAPRPRRDVIQPADDRVPAPAAGHGGLAGPSITLPLASLETALQTLLASRLATRQQQQQQQHVPPYDARQQQQSQHRFILQL